MTQDTCPPKRDDPEVICPTGLWGFRAIVGESLVSTDGAVPAPPIGVRGDLGVSYLAADLSDGPRLADMLAQVGISQVETFEELIDSFQRKSDRLGLIYLDSRHEDDGHTGAREALPLAEKCSQV